MGQLLENVIECAVRFSVPGAIIKRQEILSKRNIFGKVIRCDFLLYGISGFDKGLIVECRWQASGGTADEKFPYLVQNIQQCYPCPTIIIEDGRGATAGARSWLRDRVDGMKLIHVFTIAEFMNWLNGG
jgi:hypothetical protein